MYSDDIYHEDVLHIEGAMQEATELLVSYARIQDTVCVASKGLQLAQYELTARLASLEADLNDFDERIRLAEGRDQRIQVADPVVGYHRQYLHLARAEMEALIRRVNPRTTPLNRGDVALAPDSNERACIAQKIVAALSECIHPPNNSHGWGKATPMSATSGSVFIAQGEKTALNERMDPFNASRTWEDATPVSDVSYSISVTQGKIAVCCVLYTTTPLLMRLHTGVEKVDETPS
ncbi:hypothetical protein BD779DRAFT_1680924 [Infundibulicybe gibba]|nr:hypothetical protein BD779DRAFT_1680924 [Infundibulicybe gibba]